MDSGKYVSVPVLRLHGKFIVMYCFLFIYIDNFIINSLICACDTCTNIVVNSYSINNRPIYWKCHRFTTHVYLTESVFLNMARVLVYFHHTFLWQLLDL